MKRNRICYLLAIIAIFTVFNVYALAPGEIAGYSYCSVNNGSTSKHNTPTGQHAYEYHIQNFTPAAGGNKMDMFCTYPQQSSTTRDPKTGKPNMTCEMATVDKFPISYKLLKLVQTNNISDYKILDIAFRMAGIYDRVVNGSLVVNQGSDYQVKTFYNTYLTRVLGQSNTGFDGYYLSGPDVDQAVEYLKQAQSVDISDLKPSSDPSQTNTTGIFTLEQVAEDEHSKTYIVKANRNIENPVFNGNNIHIEWITPWNGTQGKIKISTLSERNCNGSVTISANVNVGNSSAIYSCKLNTSGSQHFIAIGPSRAGDTFDVSTCPVDECIKNGCGIVEKPTEFKQIDIHNCCEEGAVTKVRQAALNELFCKDASLDVEYYKPKCNADEYVENESTFCKQYCGATGMYTLPGPTHAKADAYFLFSKQKTGITGPVLNQYKRCRTIIYFDKWLDAYSNNNNEIVNYLNDYNQYMVKYNMINSATSQSHTETYTITCPNPNPSIRNSVVTTVDVTMTKYVVGNGTYNKYKTSLNSEYTNLTFADDGTGTVTGATYYTKDSISTAVNKYNELVQNNSNCTVSGNTSFPEYESNKEEAYAKAQSALSNYKSFIKNSEELRNKLTSCSGKADVSGTVDTSQLREKIKFNKEPEMEFSYNQVYLNDQGKLTSQELAIDFEKIDGKCAYHVYDTLDKPNKESSDWNENWDIIGMYDDNYSGKYGRGTLGIDILTSGIDFGNSIGSISNYKESKYYASKKFTTDAVGHMTCKWQDAPNNKTYTLIPGGIVSTTTITGNISNLGGVYTTRTGTYQIVKTHASGKFETYFTLKNIADGIFDDIVHNGGRTCSEYYADVKGTSKQKADGVNATCYIEIENSGLTLYDCTQQEVMGNSDTDDYYNKTCCDKESCYGYNVIDYKEVDPADMFPYDYGENYAVNWLRKDDKDAQEALKHISDAAKNNSTYSPDELTYSFTLTPKDLKAIKAYNKAVTDKGGYTDFNLECVYEKNGDTTVATKCTSKFITAISGGKALEYGNGGKLELKTNNVDLLKSRNWK